MAEHTDEDYEFKGFGEGFEKEDVEFEIDLDAEKIYDAAFRSKNDSRRLKKKESVVDGLDVQELKSSSLENIMIGDD